MARRALSPPAEYPLRNRILRSLPPRHFRLLATQLETLSLVSGQTLYEPGHVISHAYFPEDGVISHVCCPSVSSALEVAMIGYEGIVGHAPLFGVPTTVTRVVVQIPGRATRVGIDALNRLLTESASFRLSITRFVQSLFEQVTLCAACNLAHASAQRCARWMLMIHDRVNGAAFPVTQEFLAYMLGTSRQTVSAVARELQAKRLITYSRGRVTLVNRRGLEQVACPCYGTIANRLVAE